MIALLALACAPHGPVNATVTGASMGGELRVITRCPSAELHPTCLAESLAARSEVERLHTLATDWEAQGEVFQLNAAAGAGSVTVSADVEAMLRAAAGVSEATGGAFDVTIGALWGLWDFEQGRIPSDADLAARVRLVDWRRLHVEPGAASLPEAGMAVTLGGIAQGYAAERALATIPAEHEAIVDVSGDLCARGTWSVDVQDPRGPRGTSIATLALTDACLSTSGDYERFFEVDGVRYHHILDPHTGRPARGAISATVVASDGAVADALATALLITGPDAGVVERFGAWALVVDGDGTHVLGAHAGVALR